MSKAPACLFPVCRKRRSVAKSDNAVAKSLPHFRSRSKERSASAKRFFFTKKISPGESSGADRQLAFPLHGSVDSGRLFKFKLEFEVNEHNSRRVFSRAAAVRVVVFCFIFLNFFQQKKRHGGTCGIALFILTTVHFSFDNIAFERKSNDRMAIITVGTNPVRFGENLCGILISKI